MHGILFSVIFFKKADMGAFQGMPENRPEYAENT
jgi:hypothetical protein